MNTPHESKLTIDFEKELPPWDFFPLWWLAQRLHVTSKHVNTLIDTGEIDCAVDIRGKGSSRATIRVPRNAVIKFLIARKDVEAVAAANPRPKFRSESVRRPRPVANAKKKRGVPGRKAKR